MSILDLIGLALAALLFILIFTIPFVKSEREKNLPGVTRDS